MAPRKQKTRKKQNLSAVQVKTIFDHGRLLSEEEVYYGVCKKSKSMWGLYWENNTSIISYLERPESCLRLLLIEGCRKFFELFSFVNSTDRYGKLQILWCSYTKDVLAETCGEGKTLVGEMLDKCSGKGYDKQLFLSLVSCYLESLRCYCLSKTVEFQKGVTVGKNLEQTTEPKRQTEDDLTSQLKLVSSAVLKLKKSPN